MNDRKVKILEIARTMDISRGSIRTNIRVCRLCDNLAKHILAYINLLLKGNNKEETTFNVNESTLAAV